MTQGLGEYNPYPKGYDLKQKLIEYSNDVLNGKVTACQKHKWACLRFLNDIKKEGTEEFPYIFNNDAALHFLDWLKLFKHSKGILAGQRIEPHIIQEFNFGNIYGWKRKDTNYRRFNKAYWQVGRKNAKSQSLSAVGSYELGAFEVLGSEVYCGATRTDQARIVWEETDRMIRGCKELEGKFRVAYNTIYHDKSYSEMVALSKEAGKTGDGFNPQCGIIDEYHAHETDEIYDIIDSGMVARPEPLLMIITTAGYNLNNPCYAVEYKLVSKILDPYNPYTNDKYYVMINELDKDDDIKDETVWEKANPILCSYPEGIEAIRDRLKIALEAPEKMRTFLTKTMNVWIQMRDSGYMNLEKWDKCKGILPNLIGLSVIAGVDLSSTIDLTSVGFEVDLGDNEIAVLSHSFIPEETLQEKMSTDKVPYDLWIQQKWITATPGAVVDYNYVLKYIEDTYEKYNWNKGEICFDRALASWLMKEVENRGFIPVDTPQGMMTLSEPTKDFRAKTYNKEIIHDGNPVLAWAIGNAVIKEDHNGNIMLNKSKSSERIDPIASLLNGHTRAISQFKNNEEDIFYSPDI